MLPCACLRECYTLTTLQPTSFLMCYCILNVLTDSTLMLQGDKQTVCTKVCSKWCNSLLKQMVTSINT